MIEIKTKIKYRLANQNDIPNLINSFKTFKKQTVSLNPLKLQKLRKENKDVDIILEQLLLKKINSKYSFIYIGEDSISGDIAGFIDGKVDFLKFYIDNDLSKGHISHLYVNSNYRSNGIGSTLIELAIAKMQEIHPIEIVELNVQKNNPSIKFYGA